MSTYALDNYNLTSSLLWGNCAGHLQRICEGPWTDRVIHFLIGLAEAVPIIGQIISLFEQLIVQNCCARQTAPPATQVSTTVTVSTSATPVSTSATTTATTRSTPPPAINYNNPIFPEGCPQNIQRCINDAPPFNGYRIRTASGAQVDLGAQRMRPSNFFFQALGVPTSMPGSTGLFRILNPGTVRSHLEADRTHVVDVTATNDYRSVYGTNHYRITHGELLDMLDSQRIFLSPMISEPFYRGLKQAMIRDGIVEVPQGTLGAFHDARRTNTLAFLRHNALARPYLNRTFYELGTQVVKSELFHVFIDENGQMIERTPGPGVYSEFTLINMCGIRPPIGNDQDLNEELIRNAFKTGLAAAGDGIVIFPAVGMGVWGGSPDLYWPAFFRAILESPQTDHFQHICVSGGPPRIAARFLELLQAKRAELVNNPAALAKLNKIIFLGNRDVLQLARRLQLQASSNNTLPTRISLINASDPDVTLGNHVGEYVNALAPTNTTEESYTMAGTNGLVSEQISDVLNPARNRVHPLTF